MSTIGNAIAWPDKFRTGPIAHDGSNEHSRGNREGGVPSSMHEIQPEVGKQEGGSGKVQPNLTRKTKCSGAYEDKKIPFSLFTSPPAGFTIIPTPGQRPVS